MPTNKIYRNSDVLWREETAVDGASPGETAAGILFSDGQMVSLNEVGMEIWKLCDGLTTEEIADLLMADFDVSAETVQADVVAFLAELATKGFIRYA
jgi:GeoRSP system PqqD family protein